MTANNLDLESRRVARGLSVTELAKLSGVSRTTAIKVLNGNRDRARPEIIARIATVLGEEPGGQTSPEELTGRLIGKARSLSAEVKSLIPVISGVSPGDAKPLGQQVRLLANQLQTMQIQLAHLANKLTDRH